MSIFSAIEGKFEFASGKRASIAATITDAAGGLFEFARTGIVNDLTASDHKFEIQFTRVAGGTIFTLPEVEGRPIILRVRADNG